MSFPTSNDSFRARTGFYNRPNTGGMLPSKKRYTSDEIPSGGAGPGSLRQAEAAPRVPDARRVLGSGGVWLEESPWRPCAEMNICCFSLLVLKEMYHYWKYYIFFSRGLNQMEVGGLGKNLVESVDSMESICSCAPFFGEPLLVGKKEKKGKPQGNPSGWFQVTRGWGGMMDDTARFSGHYVSCLAAVESVATPQT